jgi:hypothetical protein
MANGTSGEVLSGWQDLTTSLAANSGELPHLEGHRTWLTDLLRQAQELANQQAALTASKQEASKKLQGLIIEGRKVATFLRVGVRQHYGNRAEKLIEFRLRPFRSRSRAVEPKPPTTEPQPPAITPSTLPASKSGH